MKSFRFYIQNKMNHSETKWIPVFDGISRPSAQLLAAI
jgi:hypothetical protein